MSSSSDKTVFVFSAFANEIEVLVHKINEKTEKLDKLPDLDIIGRWARQGEMK